MKEHPINILNNFIGGWYFQDKSVCDRIIEHFNDTSTQKYKGRMGGYDFSGNLKQEISLENKNSVETKFDESNLFEEYRIHLFQVLHQYKLKYPACEIGSPWGINESPKIQYYAPPEGGFHMWHSERMGNDLWTLHRHLVFMTYLNDVSDGGETVWYHQNVKIKPEKGLTIIWPCDWTFLHKGLKSKTQEKYIVTGWFNIFQN